MNVINFVILIVTLTFTIGLSVAAIIWGINWIFSPKDQAGIFSYKKKVAQMIEAYRKLSKAYEPNNPSQEYPDNMELYNYHYGKN